MQAPAGVVTLSPTDLSAFLGCRHRTGLDLAVALGAGVRVGTVDKFQGQDKAVVIYSMAASSADEAPRGMGFLYRLNRLNVATSRARCTAILVASPRLLEPECRTPEHMHLANALCRFRELANTYRFE